MLLPMVSRFQDQRQVNRYARWTNAIDQLGDDWQQGERCEVAQLKNYVQGVPERQRCEALQDLIAEHLRLTWRDGRGTFLERYLWQFGREHAQLDSPAVVPADLVEDELLARYVSPHGDMPSLDEYRRRFPHRADVMELLQQRCLDDGRYVKLKKRGQGAMGEVYEAYDRHLRRLVAIKQPREALLHDAGVLRRFAEEARLTAGLEHPSIVSVHEHCQHGTTPFYVMRLVIGETLGERIRDYHQPPIDRSRSEQRLLWNRLLLAFATVCDAMAYAHKRGVLHRDLKPGNVVVGQFGETAILDWGVAASAEDTADDTQVNLVAGTPQYMSPEQADGTSDARSDVFSLGAILYEVLTARPPRAWPEGFLPADWLSQVRQNAIAPPRRVKRRTPAALEAICIKALAANPHDRYPCAAEMAQDVHRFLAGEPVAAQRQRGLQMFRLNNRREQSDE